MTTIRSRHEIRGSRKSARLGTLAGWMMKALALTLRFEIHDRCGIGSATAPLPPVIFALWHNRFFCVPPAWQRLCHGRRRCAALTSASHDGEIVARAMGVFGLTAVRGSSSRRGVAALVGLKRALHDGSDICLTPDGPRGPRYHVQAGIIKLAQTTGAPIVPIHLQFKSAWRFKSWDRFVIPKPFSRVTVTFDQAIHLPATLDPTTFESQRQEIEALMVAATDDA